MRFLDSLVPLGLLAPWRVASTLVATETDDELTISNDRLSAAVDKGSGSMRTLSLDGQNLLGTLSGSTGQGPYLDCYCIPSGFWTPGSVSPTYELYNGTDSTGAPYGGIKMSDTYAGTGQVLEQYWFLREGETGLHTFSRVAYYNETTPFLRNLQELRTLFRPNSDIWTHLLTNEDTYAPLPGDEAVANQVVVQDATWYLGNTPNDAYVTQMADYFTKYTFADTWQDHDVHGLYADGSYTDDGSVFGAWMVMNNKETYFGGPTHSDLTVDGIVYNYISSNHHGDQTPNITTGFDRLFGPFYYHFNKADAGTDILTLRADAAQYADPEWNVDFYDSIADHLTGYVDSSSRGSFSLSVTLPKGASNAIAVLAQNGVDYQENVFDTTAYQYWGHVSSSGKLTIPRVKADTYRLTIYADGIFGQYTQDNIKVKAGRKTSVKAKWTEESAGTEVFRIGTPDKSAGEFRHGYAKDTSHPLQPEEYRIYWGHWDYPTDFPEGVKFKVGESDVGTDMNYIHWSVFGGRADYERLEEYVGNGDVNNWTVVFDLDAHYLRPRGKGKGNGSSKEATFTVQLAGVKTASGNTDVYNASEPHANLKYTININGKDLEPWVIPYYQSSSCGVRSGVVCYQVAHKFTFSADLLNAGEENEIVLSLPYNATDYESAILPGSVYVQYDALRLEIE